MSAGAGLSVKQIKEILDAAGVDYSDCTEKSELLGRLAQLRANPGMGKARRRSAAGSGGSAGGRPAAPPDRPTATRSNVQALGKKPDGTSGGELGENIRRICQCECYYEVLQVPKSADDGALKNVDSVPHIDIVEVNEKTRFPSTIYPPARGPAPPPLSCFHAAAAAMLQSN